MTINPENTNNASGANFPGSTYTAGNTGLNTPGADLGGTYATPAGADAATGAAYKTDTSASPDKNANLQKLNDVYTKASGWVKANPTLAISAAAGLFAALFGIFGARRKSGTEHNRYPSGQTYGKQYGSGAISYDPTTQTESYNPGADAGQRSSRY